MAAGAQARLKVAKVVDLAVEDDVDGPVFISDGLVATRDVNDAEPAHADRHTICDAIPTVIGAAVANGIAHCAQVGRGRPVLPLRLARSAGETRYSAHLTIRGC